MEFKELKQELAKISKQALKARDKATRWGIEADSLDQQHWDTAEAFLNERGYKFVWIDDDETLALKHKGKIIETSGSWAGHESWLLDQGMKHAGFSML